MDDACQPSDHARQSSGGKIRSADKAYLRQKTAYASNGSQRGKSLCMDRLSAAYAECNCRRRAHNSMAYADNSETEACCSGYEAAAQDTRDGSAAVANEPALPLQLPEHNTVPVHFRTDRKG